MTRTTTGKSVTQNNESGSSSTAEAVTYENTKPEHASGSTSGATPANTKSTKRKSEAAGMDNMLNRLVAVAETRVNNVGKSSYHHFGSFVAESLQGLPDASTDAVMEDIIATLSSAKRRCRAKQI
ncbi:hypothetical protein Zmor_015047 [Zophobas morio]|uniref:Uncharacterized protein n=1 Tax=Zophobas morio TaxID=2755281 RepID=A0AA38MG62_9CUCU|nr:hypothetical protein Zmor_015047 [Zophobas morio]